MVIQILIVYSESVVFVSVFMREWGQIQFRLFNNIIQFNNNNSHFIIYYLSTHLTQLEQSLWRILPKEPKPIPSPFYLTLCPYNSLTPKPKQQAI